VTGRPIDQRIFDLASRYRRALDAVDVELWQYVTVTHFPRGACGHASELLGRFLRDQLGIEPVYILKENKRAGGSWKGSHAWLETEGLIVDITGDQFGWEPVIVTSSSARHSEGELLLRQPLTADAHWWARYAEPIDAAAKKAMRKQIAAGERYGQ